MDWEGSKHFEMMSKIIKNESSLKRITAQLAGAAEYTDCTSAEG